MVRTDVESSVSPPRRRRQARRGGWRDTRRPRASRAHTFKSIVRSAAGHFLERLGWILGKENAVRRAEPLRHLELGLQGVNGDDLFRAGDARALDHREPDAAAAEHRDRRAGLDFRR